MRPLPLLLLSLPLLAACAAAPRPAASFPPQVAETQPEPPPREADEYSRYELLDPDSSQFHILFEVTAITPGATVYFNPIRKGSTASGESVRDRATGQELRFEVVSGAEARTSGLPEASLEMDYIRVHLARPVPQDGGGRLLIEKTYRDPLSYNWRKGAERIVFQRTLGIRRNAIVLPAGFELTACNAPAQILTEPDGRSTVSFVHPGPEAFPLVIEARRSGQVRAAAAASNGNEGRLSERAHQDRAIVYFLQAPETHAFDLYHDYTESRPGVDRYLNVVRKGSTASKPSARNLDTGETLRVETVKGATLRDAEEVKPDDDVVVAHFAPVPAGGSARIRIAETYTDPQSYRLDGEELVFDRTFGRPRNAVVLPAGWILTASSIPAQVSETADGRVRLDFVNPRPDEIAVLIKARRR